MINQRERELAIAGFKKISPALIVKARQKRAANIAKLEWRAKRRRQAVAEDATMKIIHLQRKTEEWWRWPRGTMTSDKRGQDPRGQVRVVLMRFAYEFFGRGLGIHKTAAVFNRTHASISHAADRSKEILETYPRIAAWFEEVKQWAEALDAEDDNKLPNQLPDCQNDDKSIKSRPD